MKVRIIASLISLGCSVMAQEAYEGYTLYNVLNNTTAKLIDMDGKTVHSWLCDASPSSHQYLFPDSTLLRASKISNPPMNNGGTGGKIQLIAWNGIVLWDYRYLDDDHHQHHDIEPMPNGNVLIIAWERKTQAEAIAMGRESISGEMWPTEIVEVNPSNDSIVWEWRIWDHLIQDIDSLKPNYGVIADHPELMNINFGSPHGPPGCGDWIHANGIDYNETLDQIVFSSHQQHEIYIIDHSTTTEEATGHTGGNSGMGGDILYRWGNPQAYNRGDASDRHIYVVHGVNWIDPGLPSEGNIILFNNGNRVGSSNDYSSVDEIVSPVDGYNYYIATDSAFGPSEPSWTYSDPGTFYSNHLSGASRLPNGNTLICEGTSGHLFEVTSAGENVWQHNCGGQATNAKRYSLDYLNDTLKIEENPSQMPKQFVLEQISPNPFTRKTVIHYSLNENQTSNDFRLTIHDITGRIIKTLVSGTKDAGSYNVQFDAKELASGIYFVKLVTDDYNETKKLTLMR